MRPIRAGQTRLKPRLHAIFGIAGHLFLCQPAGLAQGSQLQSDIPGLIGRLEAGAKIGVLEFAPQITIKVCLLNMQLALLS